MAVGCWFPITCSPSRSKAEYVALPMKSNPHPEGFQFIGRLSWLGGAFMAAAVATAAWILAHAMINGPRARAMIEWQDAAQIAQEDRAFCGKFGVAPGTPALRTCAEELGQIRRRHDERLNRDRGVF
jgi:hypothetical protein